MTIEFLSVADGRIAYQRQVGDARKPSVVFLSGYASDMTGTKACFMAETCAAQNIGFLRFDYRGCGLSSGVFADGTIGTWFTDTLAAIDALTAGPQIVIGSSMGGWLALLLARARPERMRALIGIAAAPDFTEELVWNKLTAAQRETLMRDGKIQEDGAHAPMTWRLIEEGRDHLVLRSPLAVPCPLRLIQGMRDTDVPWDYAPRLANHIMQEDIRVTLIKNGDHRLSAPEDLELLKQTAAEFL